MRKKVWFFVCVTFMECYIGMGRGVMVEEKSDTGIVYTALSPPPPPPPEGNTTFIDGTTWCVALAGVSQADLQNALDWACGLGMADCRAIQKGGPCFEPDTLVSHASFAFNSYYQTNGNSDIACNFGGTATLTKRDPSYGKCSYSSSGSLVSSAPPSFSLGKKNNQSFFVLKLSVTALLLLFYFWM